MSKKDIEQLFKEKFENFEANPPTDSWENITSKLNLEKDAKSILPFWVNAKRIGIAACLVLSFIAGTFYNDIFELENIKDRSTTTNTIKTKNKETNSTKNLELKSNTDIVDYKLNQSNDQNSVVILNPQNQSIKLEKIVTNQLESSNYKKEVNNNSSLTTAKSKYTITNNSNTLDEKSKEKLIINNYLQQDREPSSSKIKFQKENVSNQTILEKNESILSKEYNLQENTKYAQNNSSLNSTSKNEDNKTIITTKKIVAQSNSNDLKITQISIENLNQKVNTENKKETSEVLVNNNYNNLEITKIDSTIAITENPLAKIAQENEIKKIEKLKETDLAENKLKWKVKPNFSPVFMNASSGSPIDKKFADNTKTFDNNISIGLGFDYELSKKVSFRTGVHVFDLSYNTNDIAFYANLNIANGSENTRGINNINISQTASLMTVVDNNNPNLNYDEIGFQNKTEGVLNQKLGYLEIPLELSYKIIDKKFGIQVLTGMSTLFLNKNEVSLVSATGSETNLGEASNLNIIHFSSNIGLGFKYSFWKNFEANFEPTLKYQLFTFNNNSGGFKPYIIGLYSGISYKF